MMKGRIAVGPPAGKPTSAECCLWTLCIHAPIKRRSRSAVAQKFFDAALQLPLFLFALAQPLLEIGDRQFGRGIRAESNADKIVAPPDDPGEEGAALSRDRQRYSLFRELDDVAEFEVGAAFGDIADNAIPGHAAFVDLGDAAINDLVAHTLASIRHRIISQ